VELRRPWKLIGGLRYWHDTREGRTSRPRRDVPGPARRRSRIIFNKNEIFPNTTDLTASPSTPSDADATFDDVTARLELDYQPE
jgi:hypothetical protein